MNPLESFGFITEDTRIVLMDPFGKIIYTTASYFESRGLNGPKFPKLKILSKIRIKIKLIKKRRKILE